MIRVRITVIMIAPETNPDKCLGKDTKSENFVLRDCKSLAKNEAISQGDILDVCTRALGHRLSSYTDCLASSLFHPIEFC